MALDDLISAGIVVACCEPTNDEDEEEDVERGGDEVREEEEDGISGTDITNSAGCTVSLMAVPLGRRPLCDEEEEW
jgi:hypothetical protein